jgi:hypothetical protein
MFCAADMGPSSSAFIASHNGWMIDQATWITAWITAHTVLIVPLKAFCAAVMAPVMKLFIPVQMATKIETESWTICPISAHAAWNFATSPSIPPGISTLIAISSGAKITVRISVIAKRIASTMPFHAGIT